MSLSHSLLFVLLLMPGFGCMQALSATVSAIQRFDASGTPWLRPPDYYAEMVKTDEHMAKIKDRLMYEQQQIEQAEER
jgi:rRNA-processing protein EBP2